MDIIDAPQLVEKPVPVTSSQAQPVSILSGLDPELSDDAVRQALANAEKNGQDPMSAKLSDLDSLQTPVVVQEQPKLDVPQKFLTPDGVVDVEKITASTRQLDEAIQKKEEAVKSVEDYLAEYREKESKFRNMPNPQKLAATAPVIQETHPSNMTDAELEAAIRQDYNSDPVLTTSRLIEVAIEKRMEPVFRKEKEDSVRSNIAALAQKDARVLNPEVFKAINDKLVSDPDLWKLKNPHKAAWLEVKEELRLGEPGTVHAQPSRMLTPVLGGGTPPSTPSTSAQTPQNVIGNLDKLDLRDRKQEALGDEAIRAFLQGKG